MRTRSFLLVAVAIVVMATALPANACSCFQGDPRDTLADAPAAFIGTLLSKTPDADDPYSSTYTFSVEEVVKGDLGDTVDVHSATDGASCGLEVPVGAQTGLFLDVGENGGWASNLCRQIAPDELRAAAQPLPEPDGQGPIRMLVSGSLGEVGIIALDGEGRTLAYGMRQPSSDQIEMCPGSTRFIELFGDFRRRQIAVRDTSTLEVVREVDLPIGSRPYRNVFPAAMACFDEGQEIYVAAQKFSGDQEDYIFRIRGDRISRIYRGHFGSADFHDTSLFITEGKRGRFLVELDLADPHRDGIATVPGTSRQPRLSPNGEWIVMTAGGDIGKLVVVNLDRGRVRVATLGRGQAGEALWLNNRRIALLAGGYDNSQIEIFSRRLEQLRSVPGDWYTLDNFIAGSTAIGVGWGVLYRAPLPQGPAEVLRRFESPTIYSVTPVLDEVHAEPTT